MTRKKKVLIVAEHKFAALSYENSFLMGGFETEVCNDILKVFDYIKNFPVDIIFWGYDSKINQLLTSMEKIRQVVKQEDQPLMLVALATDINPDIFKPFIDGWVEQVFDTEHFLDYLDDLLQKTGK